MEKGELPAGTLGISTTTSVNNHNQAPPSPASDSGTIHVSSANGHQRHNHQQHVHHNRTLHPSQILHSSTTTSCSKNHGKRKQKQQEQEREVELASYSSVALTELSPSATSSHEDAPPTVNGSRNSACNEAHVVGSGPVGGRNGGGLHGGVGGTGGGGGGSDEEAGLASLLDSPSRESERGSSPHESEDREGLLDRDPWGNTRDSERAKEATRNGEKRPRARKLFSPKTSRVELTGSGKVTVTSGLLRSSPIDSIDAIGRKRGAWGRSLECDGSMDVDVEDPDCLEVGIKRQQALPLLWRIKAVWWCGAVLLVMGSLVNFASFGFAPQSLLASLGSVQFVSNVVFGKVGERCMSLWRMTYLAYFCAARARRSSHGPTSPGRCCFTGRWRCLCVATVQ